MLKKRKIIYALISFSLLLIIGNILIERFYVDDIVVDIHELSRAKIEEMFLSTLNDYGIKNEWVSKTTPKKKISDSLEQIYKIKIPMGISIASFIKDVNASFIDLPVVVKSFEKKNYSNSEVKIYSNNTLKFNANLIHTRKIKREYSKYGFIVKIDDQVDEEMLDKLLQLSFNYAVSFVPSEFSAELLNQLNCDYFVLLNDEIEDSQFLLDEDYSKQKLVNNIKEIIITYGRRVTYLIDENSVLYNSKIFSLLKEEFEKRKIKLRSLNSTTPLKAESEKQLNSLFHFYTISMKGKDGKNFFISFNDFILLTHSIGRQLKMGDKVVKPILE